jgi:hypothetical protein
MPATHIIFVPGDFSLHLTLKAVFKVYSAVDHYLVLSKSF